MRELFEDCNFSSSHHPSNVCPTFTRCVTCWKCNLIWIMWEPFEECSGNLSSSHHPSNICTTSKGFVTYKLSVFYWMRPRLFRLVGSRSRRRLAHQFRVSSIGCARGHFHKFYKAAKTFTSLRGNGLKNRPEYFLLDLLLVWGDVEAVTL
jgi:hypothetical protein